jgi:hypothetical protein
VATALALSAGQIRILDSQVFPGRASRLFPDPHDWSTGTSANVLMVAAGVEAAANDLRLLSLPGDVLVA